MIRRALAFVAAIVLPLPAAAAVDVQEITSPGGIEAWLVEEHSIPFVALEIRFEGGAALDNEGERGATNLMTGLLEEGSGDLDAQAFAAAAEDLAAGFSFEVYNDALSVSARFLSENSDAAISLLETALTEPRFDHDAIERVRAQVLSIIRSDQTDPGAIAQQRASALAFGDHPYGTPLEGTVESVRSLTRDDLVEAHRNLLTRDRIHVAAVGDVTPDELGQMLDRLFGDLPAASDVEVTTAEYDLEGGITVVPFDTPQSVAYFGHEGIDRQDPDFFAAYLANEIFGGSGFEARLMDEVREKRGLTYGIGTYLATMDHADLLVGQGASANDRVAEMIDVVRDEWVRMAEEGVSEAELDAIKTYLTGAYALRFDGNAQIASILVGMQMEDLPIDYIETRNDQINAVTLEDVNRVAAELFNPEALHFVVVGQPEGLEAAD